MKKLVFLLAFGCGAVAYGSLEARAPAAACKAEEYAAPKWKLCTPADFIYEPMEIRLNRMIAPGGDTGWTAATRAAAVNGLLRATRTWSAAADGALWSANASWDGGASVPATTDAIVFSNTSTHTCVIDNLGTWSGGIFTIQSTYSGTITQNTGINITTAAYSQAAGTFTCNAGATFTSTTFAMTAGTFNQGGAFTSTSFTANTGSPAFVGSSSTMTSTGTVTLGNTAAVTATSGTWSVGAWAQSGTTTFTHNSGTLNLTGTSVAITDTRSTFNKWAINAGGAVTISASTAVPLGAAPTTTCAGATLTIAGTVSWSGAWAHTGSISTSNGSTLTGTGTPTITLNLSLTITNVTTITNPIGTVTFNGTANTTITDTSDLLSGTTYALNKTGAGTLTIAASTNARFGASPTITMGSGTVTITGTFTWSGAAVFTTTGTTTATGTLTGTGTPTLQFAQSLTCSSATITNTIGTVTFSGTSTATYTDTGDKLAASTFVVSKTGSGGFTIAASTNCRMGANPTIGVTGGTGTFTVTGTWTYSGNATVYMVGTVTGTITATSTPTLTISRSLTTSGATITNTIGTVTCTLEQSTTTYTDTSAALTASTFVVSGSNAFTIAASTTAHFGASPTTSSSNFTTNGTADASGTWTNSGGSFNVATGGSITTGSSLTTLNQSGGSCNLNACPTLPAGMTFNFTGATAITYTATAYTPTLVTLNTTNNFTVASSTNCPIGTNPTTHVNGAAGNTCLTVTGTLTIGGTTWTHTGQINIGATGVITAASLTTVNLDRSFVITAGGTFPNGVAFNLTEGPVASTGFTITAAGVTFGTWTINRSTATSANISANTTIPLGNNPSVVVSSGVNFSVTGTVSGTGTFSMDGNIAVNSGGAISGFSAQTINGNLNINAAGTYPASIPILINGTLSTTLTGTTATFGTVTLNKSGSSLFSVAANTTCPLGTNPTAVCGTGGFSSLSGTISGTGTLAWSGGGDINIASGGTISGFTAVTIADGGWGANAASVIPALDIALTPGTTARNFNGGGLTYGAWRRVGSGSAKITFGSSTGATFSSFRDNDALVAHTLEFKEGATITIAASPSQYMIDGGASNTVTVQSKTASSAYTLAFPAAGKPINLRNCAITDLTTTGSEVWAGPACTGTASGTLKIAVNPRLRKQRAPTYIRPRAA